MAASIQEPSRIQHFDPASIPSGGMEQQEQGPTNFYQPYGFGSDFIRFNGVTVSRRRGEKERLFIPIFSLIGILFLVVAILFIFIGEPLLLCCVLLTIFSTSLSYNLQEEYPILTYYRRWLFFKSLGFLKR